MKLSEIYGESRDRLLWFADYLDEDDEAIVVAATPLWTVADVYRHLLGVPTDVLSGNTEGGGSEEWTAAQVARSAELSLAQVCERWAEQAEAFEAVLDDGGPRMLFPVLDVWTHEQDVLAALRRKGTRESEAVSALAERAVAVFSSGGFELPVPTRFVVGPHDFVIGDGTPELTLRTSEYEYLRLSLGRRSANQLAAAEWEGEAPERVFTALSRFALPVVDIAD
jgi:uncharacterized protein (TIGR03083 family)